MILNEIKSEACTLILKFFVGSQNWTKIKCLNWKLQMFQYRNWKITHNLVHRLRMPSQILYGQYQHIWDIFRLGLKSKGTHSAKMGADSSAENSPKFIQPIRIGSNVWNILKKGFIVRP